MKRNSAAGYFSTFRTLLKILYRDKLIRENINDFLDKIEYEDTKRGFLTLDELKTLAATLRNSGIATSGYLLLLHGTSY